MVELSTSYFEPRALTVAPQLLNKVIIADGAVSGRIIEVEAYEGADDPASHGFGGPTDRNRVMFGPSGHLYVYFVYGMHWCANVVCGEPEVCSAVLIRALEPVSGLDPMRMRRGEDRRDRELCDGPAKLCQALNITGVDNGIALRDGRVRIVDDGVAPPLSPVRTPRVGISKATERRWRFIVPDGAREL